MEEITDNNLEIYPNPSYGALKIKLKNSDNIRRIRIYNLLGELMIDKQNHSCQIGFDYIELPGSKGEYIVVVNTDKYTFKRKVNKL
ncbi:T9SS type A sorting domain-containing protein [Vicingus serpentipes]|uniref:T9SS type A sorting domain-containing protein n=1 Tax=Vicingus serpentipes TaxID=1926625 RepID=A0A5C6RQM1_9FLAO|nr:T9SS type A sorting domain-containing protein [Vicingus serpentipes]TXB64543.1 T9SS type A sorting domain-containing protein [Vicingus serpentipes]